MLFQKHLHLGQALVALQDTPATVFSQKDLPIKIVSSVWSIAKCRLNHVSEQHEMPPCHYTKWKPNPIYLKHFTISLHPCWTMGQMLLQPINFPECYALHVMYVLSVCACMCVCLCECACLCITFTSSAYLLIRKGLKSYSKQCFNPVHLFFRCDDIISKTENGGFSYLLTCVYLAMGLDSTAYTLVAPAWTAKNERMPEPQHTSRTTYRDRKSKKINKKIHPCLLTVFMW